MAANYYLLNGKNGEGNTLNLLVDGKLQRNFIDISTLDLQTMNISEENAKEVLQEYNPKLDLTGVFYNASFPHSKTETKTYATIFNQEDDRVKYYMDQLRYFAEQRNYKKEHHEKVKLDENRVLDEYIRTIIYNVLNGPQSKLTAYESMMSAKLKDILKERYTYTNGTHNYINSKIYILRNLLSSYTELRNITLEYMLYLQRKNTSIRSQIKAFQYWDNNDMEPKEPIKYIKGEEVKEIKYVQMELSDLFDMTPDIPTHSKKLMKP